MCAARRARGGLRLQGKWRTRACVPHTPYMRATACHIRATACLIPTALPRPLSRGRELERGQQAARLVFGEVRVLGKIAVIRRMPSPQPSPTGEGADCSGFKRCRSSEKECPKHQQQEFSGSLYRKADGTNAARFFQTTFEPIGRVCTTRHARGGLGLQGKWRTRVCVPHTSYMRATVYHYSYIF